jgi:class 3 adenylate cyclase/pimeloyl-ACP methyl ester carboxylesterase
MIAPRVERRLAAIMAVDVVGYSRLVERDEDRTLARLKAHRRQLIEPLLSEHRGRVVKLMGDGALCEFASVVNAVRCAVAIQRGMVEREAGTSEDDRIRFRIGINLGDVVIDGDDIFGDGVNVAARLESLCEPAGLCISRAANDQIRDKLPFVFADLGEKRVKNLSRTVGVFGLAAKDIAALPVEELPGARDGLVDTGPSRPSGSGGEEQVIRFCRSSDGVQLAFSSIGRGPPVVKTGNWMTHLEKDLESPIWRHLYRELAKEHTLVRYDARGNGLSDWDVDEISFEALVHDLEAVVEAAGVERFALLGISQGCSVSVAYATRHPERVTHLVLYGGFALGWKKRARTEAEREQAAAMLTLVRLGWGQENPAFRQLFTSQFLPDGTKEQIDWFNELQRVSTSPENAARNLQASGETDISDLLPEVAVPTLVMHARDDARVPFDCGRQLAGGIPGARFVPLQSRNHLILGDEPAFTRFIEEITAFLRK